MEFNEKLQELRKSKGLTQEELAEILYVSRTAVSKWESGRGYPNIESLKEISRFFSVSLDVLLSGEKLLSIAERESNKKIKRLCDFLFATADLFSVFLVFLPLYPNTIDGFVYSVGLMDYTRISSFSLTIYWLMFTALFAMGAIKLAVSKRGKEKANTALIKISMIINIFAVLFLALTREVYAVIVVFLLFVIKCVILQCRGRS